MTGKGMWTGTPGLADDVRYYGQWMRDRPSSGLAICTQSEAAERTRRRRSNCHRVALARTILCPNPACGARMP